MTGPTTLAVNNPPKLLAMLVLAACITVLLVTHSISSDAGVGLLGGLVGYVTGNGIAARRRDPVEPVLGVADE